MFIMKWLEQAKRKKLFPKNIAPEIDYFIREGYRLNYRAALKSKAEYIWKTCTQNIDEFSDLSKVISFFEAIEMMGWHNIPVSNSEWETMTPKRASSPAVYFRESALREGFDADESLLNPLILRLNYEFPGLMLLAEDARLRATGSVDPCGFHCVTLSCDQPS